MFKAVITALSLTSAVLAGVAATPAMAQDRSYRYSESYRGPDGSYSRSEHHESYEGYQGGSGQQDGYREGYYRGDGDAYRGRPVEYQRDDYRQGDYYRGDNYSYRGQPVEYRGGDYDRNDGYGYGRRQRCTSGTTGAIAGAVLGGLLGREIGRGGPWDRPSGTGLILGAGAGALAGRAIERSNCR
jgi:hypothetical protein